MKKSETRAKKVTVSIPADLFAWGEQERARQDLTRSEFVATLYRRRLEELAEQERLERYAAAYARQPETAEEHCWAEDAATSLAQMYADE
jgi:metal-responsive CopG/Arc/MetJ family transcriptional regulator